MRRDDRPKGERDTPTRAADEPVDLSQIAPLPYHANLRRIIRSHGATMLMTYFEIHCQPQQYAQGSLKGGSVTLNLDQIAQDVQVGRRTLWSYFPYLATIYDSEEARGRAARAQREFLSLRTLKLYSITKTFEFQAHTAQTLTLRRNAGHIRSTMTKANITSWAESITLMSTLIVQNDPISSTCATGSTASNLVQKESLAEIMLRASVLSGDRRSVRYPRLRGAIEAGLVGPEAVGTSLKGRKKVKMPGNTGFDPTVNSLDDDQD